MKKAGASVSSGKDEKTTGKKRVYNVIESDDDDEFIQKPINKKAKEENQTNQSQSE